MEHLDEFIREQFQQDDPAGRFPFREEYWEQALPLIEAAERRRRRGIFWWWFAGLLLLLGGWWGWRHSGLDRNRSLGQSFPTGINASDPTRPGYVIDPEAGYNPSFGIPVIAYENQGNSTDIKKDKNKLLPPTRPQRSSKTTHSIRPGKEGKAPPAMGIMTGSSPESSADLPASQSAASGTADLNSVPQNAQNTPGRSGAQADSLAATPAGLLPEAAARQNITQLATPFLPLFSGPGSFALARVPYNFPVIKPLREPIFAIGLQASATAYRPAPAGRSWGLSLGVYGEYWLRPAWSVSAGLGWRKQAVSDTTVLSAYQLHYRFGYEEDLYRQEDRTLHYLEVPLGLHWYHRTWQIETGVTFGHLLRVAARQTQTSRSSLIPNPEVTEQRIPGEKSGYRPAYTALFAGLGWQPLRRLQVEIKGTYRPTSLFPASAETAPANGGFWLDAGLRWQLFSGDRIRVK